MAETNSYSCTYELAKVDGNSLIREQRKGKKKT